MTKTSIKTKVTVAEAFELGRREGLREAFIEIKKVIPARTDTSAYIEARLKSIQDFSFNNPFKQKD